MPKNFEILSTDNGFNIVTGGGVLSKDEKELLTNNTGTKIDASNLNDENKEKWREALISAGDGIKIENGEISQKQLIVDTMIPASTKVYTISDLDIIADGGYYEVEIYYPANDITYCNIWMRINGIASGGSYVHGFTCSENSAIVVGSQSVENRAYLGTIGGSAHKVVAKIYLDIPENETQGIPFWDITNWGYTGHLYYEKFYGYSVKSENITSITIIQDNISIGGMSVKIWRR